MSILDIHAPHTRFYLLHKAQRSPQSMNFDRVSTVDETNSSGSSTSTTLSRRSSRPERPRQRYQGIIEGRRCKGMVRATETYPYGLISMLLVE